MKEIENILDSFRHDNGLEMKLSYNMPKGYETAYGTYDVSLNTLFLNAAILQDAPRHEALFYLFHELRHAMQYSKPALLDEQIRESIAYVILYNGTCYKLAETGWQKCVLDGDEEYFTRAYLSLPYEVDANSFAYEKAREICGDTVELRRLRDFWIPEVRLDYEGLWKLFLRIDEELISGGNAK